MGGLNRQKAVRLFVVANDPQLTGLPDCQTALSIIWWVSTSNMRAAASCVGVALTHPNPWPSWKPPNRQANRRHVRQRMRQLLTTGPDSMSAGISAMPPPIPTGPSERTRWSAAVCGQRIRVGPSRDIAPRGVTLRNLFHTDYFISR